MKKAAFLLLLAAALFLLGLHVYNNWRRWRHRRRGRGN